jgi:GPH family glycoside/pentoside/hexuronide:cation symporter
VQLFNVVGSIALIVALPLSKPLAKRFGKKNVFVGSSLLSGTFFCLLYLPGAQSIGWIYVLNVLGKMAYAPAVPLLWTMIADAADYAEWTSGRRATGLFFSAATFAQKGGWGIGGALAGWLLAAYGYVEKATEQTAHALTGIKMLISVFPGLLYISCAFVLIFYTIDEATGATMKRELEERRAEESAEPER